MRHYYELTKPGLVYGNMLTALAAFLFGVHVFALPLSWVTLAALVCGLGLSIAAACVFNNVLDREYDAKMERTRERALPTGIITPAHALLFGTILLLLGLGYCSSSFQHSPFSLLLWALSSMWVCILRRNTLRRKVRSLVPYLEPYRRSPDTLRQWVCSTCAHSSFPSSSSRGR
jgi:heme O synthase-like polyprenyltransferase